MRMGILAYPIPEEMKIVSKMKDIQVEMEDICLDSLFRSKN